MFLIFPKSMTGCRFSWIDILYSRMISASTYMMTALGTLNPTIRANRQVVVRQYTRGLRIALEFNDVSTFVASAAARRLSSWPRTTDTSNCLDVHCEIPFCGGLPEGGAVQMGGHDVPGREGMGRGGGFAVSL